MTRVNEKNNSQVLGPVYNVPVLVKQGTIETKTEGHFFNRKKVNCVVEQPQVKLEKAYNEAKTILLDQNGGFHGYSVKTTELPQAVKVIGSNVLAYPTLKNRVITFDTNELANMDNPVKLVAEKTQKLPILHNGKIQIKDVCTELVFKTNDPVRPYKVFYNNTNAHPSGTCFTLKPLTQTFDKKAYQRFYKKNLASKTTNHNGAFKEFLISRMNTNELLAYKNAAQNYKIQPMPQNLTLVSSKVISQNELSERSYPILDKETGKVNFQKFYEKEVIQETLRKRNGKLINQNVNVYSRIAKVPGKSYYTIEKTEVRNKDLQKLEKFNTTYDKSAKTYLEQSKKVSKLKNVQRVLAVVQTLAFGAIATLGTLIWAVNCAVNPFVLVGTIVGYVALNLFKALIVDPKLKQAEALKYESYAKARQYKQNAEGTPVKDQWISENTPKETFAELHPMTPKALKKAQENLVTQEFDPAEACLKAYKFPKSNIKSQTIDALDVPTHRVHVGPSLKDRLGLMV